MLSEVAYLRERYPECRVSVCTYDPKSTLIPADWGVRYFSYFPNGFRNRPMANAGYFFRTLWEIFRADLVVIGGGGIFYDNESGQSFRKQVFEWSLRAGAARLFRKKLLYWGIGVDVKPERAGQLAKLFRNANVTVRDAKSAQALAAVGVAAKVVPDPAFLVPAVRPADAAPNKTVGISVRKGYLRGELDAVRHVVRIVRENGFEPVFLNHSFHPGNPETDDRAFVSNLAKEEGVRSLDSMDETMHAYRSLGAVVAMRLHAGVLSFINGIPFFLLSYSKKTDAFAERVGSEWIMPSGTFDEKRFSEAFARFAREVSAHSGPFFALSEKCGKIREEARNSYDEIFYGLERAER